MKIANASTMAAFRVKPVVGMVVGLGLDHAPEGGCSWVRRVATSLATNREEHC